MKDARGITGSSAPQQAGIFVCLGEFEVDWFVHINNTGGSADVWGLEGLDGSELIQSAEGYFFLPRPIPPSQLTLTRTDIRPPPDEDEEGPPDGTSVWTVSRMTLPDAGPGDSPGGPTS
jgi:hypothetical protein